MPLYLERGGELVGAEKVRRDLGLERDLIWRLLLKPKALPAKSDPPTHEERRAGLKAKT